MPIGQGWLNAWVKVNSKHVVFPPNSKTDRDNDKEDVLNRSSGKSQKGSRTGSVTTARTDVSEDAETQAIRRFNHRKHRRRLQRTVSASDLLRDKAKGKGEKGDKKSGDESEAALDKSSSTQATSNHHKGVPHSYSSQTDNKEKASINVPQHMHEDRSIVSVETEGSLRFVAGFFGADIESLEAGAAQHPSGSFNHDAASVQAIGEHAHLDAASVVSRGGQSLPARPYRTYGPPPRTNSNDSAKSGGIGIRFPPNLFTGDNNAKGHCRQCSRVEAELFTSREDLEYLRGLALRSEYMCATCQTEPSKRLDTSSQVSSEVSGGAQMLNEVTERHKVQVEKLIQERARWQQDTHVKIQKYASLCKDLNEEASLRNEEALALHKELDSVRAERDDTATELEKARALIARYERNEEERKKSELILRQYEQKGLDGADRAVQTRDSIIVDLAGRLERALDMLELEREQQRQRRQIIFPTQRPSQKSLDGRIGEELEAELKGTKYSLRECQSARESLKRDADKKEMEWKVRIEILERQLEAARSQ